MNIIAIDPGASGAIAWAHDKLGKGVVSMPDTPKGIYDELSKFITASSQDPICFIESVHSMPGQGVASSFKFGKHTGYLEMALLALKIPTEYVTPQRWMKTMGIGTRGDDKNEWKRRLKQKAEQLYPGFKVTLINCDALLLLHYAQTLKGNVHTGTFLI